MLDDPRRHRKLAIAYQPTSELTPRSNNPRTHSKKQIAQISNAIRRFGFTNPVLVDDDNGVIAGHGRLEAAKSIGLSEVPTVRLRPEKTANPISSWRLGSNHQAGVRPSSF